MRRAAKVDANHRLIVAVLRSIGASVQDLASVGQGCPDILVGWRGVNYLMEIKVVKGTTTAHQVEWHGAWRGHVAIVRTVDDALQVIGVHP